MDAFNNIQAMLGYKDSYDQLKNEMKGIGGDCAQSHTRNILKRCFPSSMIKGFSNTGKGKDKVAFLDTSFHSCIKGKQ